MLIINYSGNKCHKFLSSVLHSVVKADLKRIEFVSKEVALDKIKNTDYSSVLILGGNTYEYIFGEYKKIADITPFEYEGKNISVTYSPSFVSKNSYLVKSFSEHVYKSYIAELPTKHNEYDIQLGYVNSMEDWEKALSYCIETGVCSFDFETIGLDTREKDFKATSLSISFQDGSSYVAPLEHFENDLFHKKIYDVLSAFHNKIILNPDVEKIAHNIQFEFSVLASYGFRGFLGQITDTVLLDHKYKSDRSHRLKELVANYIPQYAGYEDNVSKFGWDKIPYDIQELYNGLDSMLTLRLATFLESELMKDIRAYTVYRNITMPSTLAVWRMSDNGMYVDVNHLEKSIESTEIILSNLNDSIYKIPNIIRFVNNKREKEKNVLISELESKRLKHKEGSHHYIKYTEKIAAIKSGAINPYDKINFNSFKQMQELLYSSIGFNFKDPAKIWEKPMRTDEDTIKYLPDTSGFIDSLLLYRKLSKTLSTYLVGIKNLTHSGKVHSSYKTWGTRTHRLSSSKPNMQNITDPSRVKNETAKKVVTYIREAFNAPNGYKFVQCDYSQIELRIAALMSQCKNMLKIYDSGGDIHVATAATVNGLSLEEFYSLPKEEQKLLRFKAKAVNFGFLYAQSPEGFKDYAKNKFDIEYTLNEATKIRKDFFTAYPELLDYADLYIKRGRKFSKVRNYFGSYISVSDIQSNNEVKSSHAERQCINSPVQSTAGMATVWSIVFLFRRLHESTIICNTIHDSVMFYIREDLLDSELKVIQDTMENLPIETYFGKSFTNPKDKKGVTLKVDFEVGNGWIDLSDYTINN